MTDYEIYEGSFVFLLFKVTPSLRCVYLMIERDSNHELVNLVVIAIFEKSPTEREIELMDDLGSDIMGMVDDPIYRYESKCIVDNRKFEDLGKLNFLLYARYENGYL